MLTFVHEGRGTSSNLLLHPHLPDVRSSSFTAFAATTCLTSPTSWNTSVVATLCCYTPAVTHHGIMPSSMVEALWLLPVMQRKRREDGHQNVAVNPLAATPLFSPARAALFGLVVYKPRGRRVAKPKICRKASLLKGNAPFPLVSPDLSAMASPTLAIDPSDVARRVVDSTTYGLYGVAANGLT
ncbi:hypothetical protein DAPPUDRAFT_101596 [Daphnia pulex]|uniref:Uncharacterized protein n=1 Tax=Daphnia pulex TaxID=6669 RepID=E9GDW6_DAPPU|nr:hypothetical protein DAPPUDRAFT_101596 [Daphnia pulex]|eukprot:EFX82411.1 hypothetical protein DAPPUDRAFT_101596 [Daphnia pulex]